MAAPPTTNRRALPDRNVDDASIEDAYVAFVLYCNPGVPLETDTAALREAFRTPPKSGGKSFSTFTLFELIKKLETKELKTWAELALKLGVEPPDQEKGQSSQKIQQYAVRLKRWMHSMHVDAFFEYLIDRPSPYWTEIPAAHIPIADLARDGVAAEDDMALRALLPQIKPRRGRRKPDDDETGQSPSRRPSPHADDFGSAGRPDAAEPWTAQPDGRGSVFLFPPVPDPSRLSAASGQSWTNTDIVQTPLTAFPIPQSAVTPSTRNAFWADEPRSAITPSKARAANRRHGAKVVSSAWRSGGIGSGGKTRGRPPTNRVANPDGPFSAFPTSDAPVFRFPSPTPDRSTASNDTTTVQTSDPRPAMPATTHPSQAPLPTTAPSQPQSVHTSTQPSPIAESPAPRPAKRSRLSLQVPERVGGEVRLATPPPPGPVPPPPVVMVNGQQQHQHQPTTTVTTNSISSHPAAETAPPTERGISAIFAGMPSSTCGGTAVADGTPAPDQQVFFHDPTDRTNVDEVEALFVSKVLAARWYDAKTQRQVPAGGVDEAYALAHRVIENLIGTATSKEGFLINLSALVGGQILMPRGSLRITIMEEMSDRTRYSCAWQLRFGDIVGDWAMEETVMHEKWKKRNQRGEQGGQGQQQGAGGGNHAAAPTNGTGSGQQQQEQQKEEEWERRYRDLAATLQRREDEMLKLKARILQSVQDC